MITPQPKKQIDKFIEEIEKAKTKEELENILKRMETFTKIYPYEENLIVLAYLYGLLKRYNEALEILKPLKSYKAKYLEAEILQIIKNYEKAYKLFSELEKIAPNEEEKMKIIINRLEILMAKGELEKAREIYENYGEKLLLFANKIGKFKYVRYISNQLEKYKKGLDLLNKDRELHQIKNELEELAYKYFKNFKIYPVVLSYYDGDDENLTFYIVLSEKVDKEIGKKFMLEMAKEIDFKHPDKEFYVSIKYPKKREGLLVHT
ncbi:MAG: hypothetical protein DSY59_03185 [Persephonella sp.]|nr:MAG: hypothetical protein DSY59_03185 [Persephonella sp.]